MTARDKFRGCEPGALISSEFQVFSLIVVLVSVALVAALVLAVVYYGGSSFLTSGSRAEAARVLNGANQITGAATAYKATTGDYAPDINALVTSQHLTSPPGNWTVYQGTVAIEGIPTETCEAINKMVGVTGVPACSSLSSEQSSACCELAD